MKSIIDRMVVKGKAVRNALVAVFALVVGAAMPSFAADWIDADGNEYTALKYIKGNGSSTTGGPYIITDFKPVANSTVKLRFKPTTVSDNECLFCSRKPASSKVSNSMSGFRISNKIRLDRYHTGRYVTCNTTSLAANNDYSLSADFKGGTSTKGIATINGIDQTLSAALGNTAYTPASKLTLFASHEDENVSASSTFDYKGSFYLYYFQLYSPDDGSLAHNMMPAKNSSGVAGLYDTVTRTFYGPTGPSGYTTFTSEDWGTDRAGKKWTGLGADNKMSNGDNWEGGVAPQAGDDLDFTIAVPFAAIDADIDATFGKVYLGTGDLPAFSGTLTAIAVNDLARMQAYDTATDDFTFTPANLTWNGGAAANWNTTDASWLYNSAASVWYDDNNAIFNTADATATLTADATANSLTFNQNAIVAGSATLTVPTVSVATDVSATISAPTAGPLEKVGAGTLTLGSSRTEQTTLTEGTLAMASGATLDVTKLTLGTDPAKPVSLNLGGAGLSADLSARMSATVGGAAGGSVSIDNGAITNTANLRVGNGSLTLGSDVHVTMNASADRWVCVGGNKSSDESVTDKDAYLVLDGASITKNGSKNVFLGIGDFGSYPSKGTMIVKNGGSYTSDNSAYVAQGCEGHLVIDGVGSSVSADQLLFCNMARCAANENGYVVVTNGGTLAVRALGYGSGKGEGYFRFDGGTLRATAAGMTLLPAHEKLHYEVGAEGGTIDNDGNNITIAQGLSGTGMINLTGSGTTTFAAGVGAEGGVSVANGTTLALDGATQSSFGAVTLAAGSTFDIATPAPDTAAFAATTLNLPAEGTVALTSGGGEFVEGLYAICKMSGVTAADGAKFAPSNGTLAVSWSVDGDMLMLTVGTVDHNTWTGRAGDRNLSNSANWYGLEVPTSGTATINTSGELTVGTLFSPDVIVFPETCGAVTITGENGITGLSAVTNLSSSTCTFEVPVAFADKINVSQGAYYGFSDNNPVLMDGGKVRFAGGVTGTAFADGSSRRLDGAFTIPATANWVANTSDKLWTVTGDSSLTLTGYPAEQQTNDYSWLNNNGAFTTAVIRTSSRVCLRNEGEFVVTEELAMTLPGEDRHIAQRASQSGKYKFEKVTLGDNGKAGVFYIANSGNWYTDKHVYIGAGGLCFAEGAQPNTAYAFGRRASDDIYIYPWHSDYTIGAKGGTTRDIIVIEPTYFQTDDADGVARTVTLNGVADVRHTLTVNGHGRFQVNSDGMSSGGITVTDSATLAYASGADLGAGAVTVGVNATMEVASGVNTFGGLTVRDGATLAFNFTERAVTPQIAVADGKTLTVEGAVKVKIAEGSLRPTGGEHVLTTCGGFTAENVTLVAGAPKWVRGLSVNDDGNIVLDVKPMGMIIIFR